MIRLLTAMLFVYAAWSNRAEARQYLRKISSHWLTVGGGIEVPLGLFSGVAGTTRDYLWQR